MESFLGYRPTVGELIVGLMLAVVAVPIWHRISRIWDYLLDRIASVSNVFQAIRIVQLDKHIKYLQGYNEHKALLRLLRRIFGLIVSIGLLSPVFMSILTMDTAHSLHQIKEALHVVGPTALGLPEPSESVAQAMFAFGLIVLVVMLITVVRMALTTLNEIDDFADPAEAIKRLEERMGALLAKRRTQKTA